MHGIKVRNKLEAYISRSVSGEMIFNNKTWQILNGCLLGDGWLTKSSSYSNASFHKKNIHYEHIKFVAKEIFGDKYQERIRGPIFSKNLSTFKGGRKIKSSHPYFEITSLVHKELTNIYNSWYRNGQKTIPKKIKITPLVLLHWFMDDGYSYFHGNTVRIGLCSQSFTKKDQNFLRKLLFDNFGIRTSLTQKNDLYFVAINSCRENIKLFYTTIGPCPIKCFEYKWKDPFKNNPKMDKWQKTYSKLTKYVKNNKRLPLVKDKKLYIWARQQRYVNSGSVNGNLNGVQKELLNQLPLWKW